MGQRFIDDGEISAPVIIVPSWQEAMDRCLENEWGLALNELTNSYRRDLARKSPESFRTWNNCANAIKVLSKPLVKTKFDSVRLEYGLTVQFEGMVHAQVAMVLMEAEYSHIISPAGFSKLAFWLVNGHVPCGWKGEFPNGNLVIY